MTKEQHAALRKLWDRMESTGHAKYDNDYESFVGTAHQSFGDCVVVPWCGMVIGIEPDGYTHS